MNIERENAASEPPKHRWIIRQVARRLRYRTLGPLIGQNIILQSLDGILADVQAVIDSIYPGCRFRRPEERLRKGALAKYGLLDLEYDAPPEMADQNPSRGLLWLKELGFVGHSRDTHFGGIDEDEMFAFVTGLFSDFDKNQTILKLFMEERPKRSFPPPADWTKQLAEPSLMPFPKTMVVIDACVTNSGSVWLIKHFYM
jgi:hypothetical protein